MSNWTGSAWVRTLDEKYIYDGWNLLVIFNGTNNALLKSFVWGTDISGTHQRAGGVAGLVFFKVEATPTFAAYDGNGNVAGLISAKDGTVTARYEYGPLGEFVRASGSLAIENPFRFSTKHYDDESDNMYYGFRYYSSGYGRWSSRDPVNEKGGLNLFAFLANDPLNHVDILGQRSWPFGAGRLCVDKECDKRYLPKLRYLPEDPPYVLHHLPSPGQCVDADAVYYEGGAKKISDNASVFIDCYCTGALYKIKYIRWPWWIGSGSEWTTGGPRPDDWAGDEPPF